MCVTPSGHPHAGRAFCCLGPSPCSRRDRSVCLACGVPQRLRSDRSGPSTCAVPRRTLRGMSSPLERMRRRGAALILGAAALGAAATTHALASTPAGATSPARVVPACRATQLTAWQAIPFDGAAGSFYYELEFSNVSRTTCRSSGSPEWPRLTPRTGSRPPRDPGGWSQRTSGAGARSDGARGPETHRRRGVPHARVPPDHRRRLQIFPPNTSQASIISESLRVCSSRAVSYLSVRPVHAGVGIPGYSQ